MVLTPEGKMARYLYGINVPARATCASAWRRPENRSTITIEKVLLFCYHYDPNPGQIRAVRQQLMRPGAP